MKVCTFCRSDIPDIQSCYTSADRKTFCRMCFKKMKNPDKAGGRFVDMKTRGVGLNAAQQAQRGMLD